MKRTRGDEVVVVKLSDRDELLKACQRGGYVINIDSAGNVIHICGCEWTLKMKPEKSQGGSYYCRNYVEAIKWIKKKYSKFKECEKCLSGRRHAGKEPSEMAEHE